jgi:hypothetical protein
MVSIRGPSSLTHKADSLLLKKPASMNPLIMASQWPLSKEKGGSLRDGKEKIFDLRLQERYNFNMENKGPDHHEFTNNG